ncbi:hypothetical protein N9Y17_04390 [Gammaproteobacteria bacterium]|nr:hypothetical protein [Gammaproteobacteria bacterium]
MKIINQSYLEFCTKNPMFKYFLTNDSDQERQSQVALDLPRGRWIITHGDIEITKNHLSQNWHGGFSQGDLDGTIFAESLLKQLKQKMGMDDPFTPVYFEEISFCYDGDNGKFHGFTLAQISTADKPDQPIFLMAHIENINGHYQDREITLLGHPDVFDHPLITAINQALIQSDDFNDHISSKLSQVIKNKTVLSLIDPVFNGQQINQSEFNKIQIRLCNFNIDHFSQKQQLLAIIDRHHPDLPGLTEQINMPVGDSSWIEQHFQTELKQYLTSIPSQTIDAISQEVEQISDPDEEKRGLKHIQAHFQRAYPQETNQWLYLVLLVVVLISLLVVITISPNLMLALVLSFGILKTFLIASVIYKYYTVQKIDNIDKPSKPINSANIDSSLLANQATHEHQYLAEKSDIEQHKKSYNLPFD